MQFCIADIARIAKKEGTMKIVANIQLQTRFWDGSFINFEPFNVFS